MSKMRVFRRSRSSSTPRRGRTGSADREKNRIVIERADSTGNVNVNYDTRGPPIIITTATPPPRPSAPRRPSMLPASPPIYPSPFHTMSPSYSGAYGGYPHATTNVPYEGVGENDNERQRHDSNRGYAFTPYQSPYSSPQNVPGPEEYVKFYWKTNDLLSELARMQYALRTVGACGPGIQAINDAYRSFELLQVLFGYNTYALNPRDQDPRFKQLRIKNDAYLAQFPKTLEAVSEALRHTRKALKDFQAAYYQSSLMYLLECLEKRFMSESKKTCISKGSYSSPSSQELKERIQLLLGQFLISAVEALQSDVSNYCDKGVPVISSMQKTKATRYLNLTTIATFLSGVTASLLQISADDTTGAVAIGVNTFLFTSLTFSIASAISSLLTLTWLKAVVRDPTTYMPFWLSSCIVSGPMISLVISVALFAAALSLFVFSSGQHIITRAVTISFAGFYALGLLLIGAWLIFEKWNFRKVAGPVGHKLTGDSLSMAILDWMVVLPAKFNAALTGSNPDMLERGRSGSNTTATFMSSRPEPHALFDGLKNNFLYGTTPSSLGRPGGSHSGSIYPGSVPLRPSNLSASGRIPPGPSPYHVPESAPSTPWYPPSTANADTENYGSGYGHRARQRRSSRSRSRSRSRSPPSRHRPNAPTYAPSEYGDTEDHSEGLDGYGESGGRRRSRQRSPDYDDQIQIVSDPIVVVPPVDSHTYLTSRFLPRDEYGELEDIEAGSTSESDESGGGYGRPSGMPELYSQDPGVPIIPPPPSPRLAPALSAPAPLATSYSERVMVIPTNPPTYVVPPGSYVAYGTQPVIGPTSQAGNTNYTFYDPGLYRGWPPQPVPQFPPTPFVQPMMVPVPPPIGCTVTPPPIIPPASATPYFEPFSAIPRPFIPPPPDFETLTTPGGFPTTRPSQARSEARSEDTARQEGAERSDRGSSYGPGVDMRDHRGESTIDGRSERMTNYDRPSSRASSLLDRRNSFPAYPSRQTSVSSSVAAQREMEEGQVPGPPSPFQPPAQAQAQVQALTQGQGQYMYGGYSGYSSYPNYPSPYSGYGSGQGPRLGQPPPRRSSSGLGQVRFAQPEVTVPDHHSPLHPPQRRRSTGGQTNVSLPQSTTSSFFSQPLTSEPEDMEMERRWEYEAEHGRGWGWSGRQSPGLLLSMDRRQQRPRQRTDSSEYSEGMDRPRSRSDSRRTTADSESQTDEPRPPISQDSAQRVGPPPSRVQSSDRPGPAEGERRPRPDSEGWPSAWGEEPRVGIRPYIPSRLSTVSERTEPTRTPSSGRPDTDDDSGSSVHSATTAPETMGSESKSSRTAV